MVISTELLLASKLLLSSKLLLPSKLLLAAGLASKLLLAGISIELLLGHAAKLLLAAELLLPAVQFLRSGLLIHVLLLHSCGVFCGSPSLHLSNAARQQCTMVVRWISAHGIAQCRVGIVAWILPVAIG